jgi:hypothetical protein
MAGEYGACVTTSTWRRFEMASEWGLVAARSEAATLTRNSPDLDDASQGIDAVDGVPTAFRWH